MDKKTKILFLFVLSIFGLTTFTSYANFFLLKNYQVNKQVDCDPQLESCFVVDCQVDDPNCDQTPYKKISAKPQYAGLSYDDFSCSADSSDCNITFCQLNTLEIGEKCL